jgi:hypothetical protein
MNKQNCLTCKNSRSDYGFFGGIRFHCDIEHVHPKYAHWYLRQHLTDEQWDIICAVGCASWQNNQ